MLAQSLNLNPIVPYSIPKNRRGLKLGFYASLCLRVVVLVARPLCRVFAAGKAPYILESLEASTQALYEP